MEINIQYSDGTEYGYDSIEEAEAAILEIFAEGVLVDYIEDSTGRAYSCIWSVKLQEEV